MDWNAERIETLTRLWREGLSASQVARQMGELTRSAVIGKVHRLGIAGRDTPSRPRNAGGRPSNRARASAGGQPRRPSHSRAPRGAPPPQVDFEVGPTSTLLTLTAHGCRWPIGDPDATGFGFCGRMKAGRGAYCAGHAPMALSRRITPMKVKEIEHLVRRFGDLPSWGDRPAIVG
jgi:GcrA cell cycle regulator